MCLTAGTYPLPSSTVRVIFTLAFESKVQIWRSLFSTSTWAPQSMSAAFISLGPFALIWILVLSTSFNFKANCLIFKIISVTSSITPGIEENSWVIPSTLIEVTAAPLIEDSKTLLSIFPKVCPYPLSSGSATNSALVKLSLSLRNSIFLGLISSFQFLLITIITS